MSKTEPPKYKRENEGRYVSKEERENPKRVYSREQSKLMVIKLYKVLQNNADIQELIIKNDYDIKKVGFEEAVKYIEKDLDHFILGNPTVIKQIQEVFAKYGIHIPEQKCVDKNEVMTAKQDLIETLLIKRE